MVLVKDALISAFHEAMEQDPMVILIGEEVGASGGPNATTVGLLEKFGSHRVIDTPISEIGFTGLAVGASFLGLRPIVDFMTWNFSLQAIDHIINSCAKTSYMSASRVTCPIVFRGPSGYNPGYAAQHVQEFFTYYGSVPGLKVVAPYTAEDHRRLMLSAILDNNPVVFLENEVLYNRDFPVNQDVSEKGPQPLDKAVILKSGKDVTVVGASLALDLIDSIKEETNVDLEIINLISIRPLDLDTIFKSVEKTRRLVIVDYSWPCFSVSSEIASRVYKELYGRLKSRIECLNTKDTHVPYAENIEKMCYPSKEDLIESINRVMKDECFNK